ncbi:hypothetical protein [Photobacterium damselae]|uniref:hypothetical protein n=1 Tax=Photobacterium damselae TaxID=38293 RepID=UPI0040680652
MTYSRVSCTELKKQLKSHKGKMLKEQFRDTHTSTHKYVFSDAKGNLVSEVSDGWEIYPKMRNQSFRRFSTKQECSAFQMHALEYHREYGHFLRLKRSDNSLPNAYDELPSSNLKLKQCWKNNSKRMNQYYK